MCVCEVESETETNREREREREREKRETRRSDRELQKYTEYIINITQYTNMP